jgi:hypothetical protein
MEIEKHQITSTKNQINSPACRQAGITKTQNVKLCFGDWVLEIGIYLGFGIWSLGFKIGMVVLID